jgi:hypothetical protein
VHCGENHPANYRSCDVNKDLLKFRNNSGKAQSEGQTGKERKNKRKPFLYSQTSCQNNRQIWTM